MDVPSRSELTSCALMLFATMNHFLINMPIWRDDPTPSSGMTRGIEDQSYMDSERLSSSTARSYGEPPSLDGDVFKRKRDGRCNVFQGHTQTTRLTTSRLPRLV